MKQVHRCWTTTSTEFNKHTCSQRAK